MPRRSSPWPHCSRRPTPAPRPPGRWAFGTPAAAKVLEEARLALRRVRASWPFARACCASAEALAADGESAASQAIYDRLRKLADAPHQVRTAAPRGAVLARGKDGMPILAECSGGADYALAAAAVRTAMEMPGAEVTDVLAAELAKVPAERQGLLILALADRGDRRVVPAVLKAAEGNDPQLRILAFQAPQACGRCLLRTSALGGRGQG